MTDYQQVVVDFLAQPDNLPIALEVADHIEQVKDRFQKRFWAAFQSSLDERLAQSGAAKIWRVTPRHQSDALADYYTLGLEYVGTGKHRLNFLLQQGRRGLDNRLTFGICWNQKTETDFGLPEMRQLAADLARQSFRPSPPWYVGEKYLDHKSRGNEFLLRMANDDASLVADIVQIFWTFFEAFGTRVETINQALVSVGLEGGDG